MTFARDPHDQELLIDYVRQALSRIDAGEDIDPIALTALDPHLARPLAEVLGLAADLPLLQAEAVRSDPLAGMLLAGRYRLDACRGRGAMGVVYAAEDRELGRAVAVKILDARLFRDDHAEQRFAREAQALATLQDPHVVTVFDRGRTAEGIHYLVMELLDGATLAELLERVVVGGDPVAIVGEVLGAPPAEAHWPRLAATWAAAIARGLSAAHARGLVHRDVKPSNVFVRRDGRPVLLDFGIAAQDSAERLTATQTTLGTPWYMAPEQVRAAPHAAAPTLDVYALGATLYHLLAGQPPYEGDAAAVLAALPNTDPVPLQRRRPDVPRDLVAIVDQCLERDPARRYRDGAGLAQDLEAFLTHQPVAARPIGALSRRLRQWRRAPAKPIAVAALLLTLAIAAIAAPFAIEQRRLEFQRQKDDLYATLPSVLAIEGWPDERTLTQLEHENRAAIDLLDRILTLDAADLPVRLWRAALRLDLGDRQGAGADLRQLAAAAGGGYLTALAQRYLQADATARGSAAIDTRDLPEPVTPPECYVAGFHELRARDQKGYAERADALLERASGAYLPARDLRLLSLAAVAETKPEAERKRLTDLLYDETIKLEEIYGRDTARTQAMRGVALLLDKQYAESVPCFERSLELRPERHGPHQNLGIAHLRLGEFAASERHLQAALRLRPFAWNTKYTLAQLELARGDFAAAYEWADRIETQGPFGQAWRQPYLRACIAIDEAIARRSDEQVRRDLAERAVADLDRALAVLPRSRRLQQRRQLAEALQEKLLSAAMVGFARTLLDGDAGTDPTGRALGPYQLRNLILLMPPTLDEAGTAWVKATLRRIVADDAGGNEVLRRQMEQDIEEGLAGFR